MSGAPLLGPTELAELAALEEKERLAHAMDHCSIDGAILIAEEATGWKESASNARLQLATLRSAASRACDLEAERDRLREALERIVDDAPTEKPEPYEGDNRGEHRESGYMSAHFYDAQIARAALGRKP